MKRKPIKIDWEDLEEAFTRQSEEVSSHLDLVTGHVILEGEGEEDEDIYDEDATHFDRPPAKAPPISDSTMLPVRPPDTELKIEWLEAFLATDHDLDTNVVQELEQGMVAENPGKELKAIMNRNAKERDAWYAYRANRVRELIEKWLEQNGVQPVTPPPWK